MQLRLGWSEEAMIAGARDVGVSPSIVGSFPRKEAALVEVLFLKLDD
jgi:ubiquinone biosynthesis protein COQ9